MWKNCGKQMERSEIANTYRILLVKGNLLARSGEKVMSTVDSWVKRRVGEGANGSLTVPSIEEREELRTTMPGVLRTDTRLTIPNSKSWEEKGRPYGSSFIPSVPLAGPGPRRGSVRSL